MAARKLSMPEFGAIRSCPIALVIDTVAALAYSLAPSLGHAKKITRRKDETKRCIRVRGGVSVRGGSLFGTRSGEGRFEALQGGVGKCRRPHPAHSLRTA